MTRSHFPLFLLLLLSVSGFSQGFNSSALHNKRGEDATWMSQRDNHRALYDIISQEAYRLLDERKKVISSLNSQEDWEEYRSTLRTKMYSGIDQWKKTPLYPKITGVIEEEDLRIEKILFESHPEFYVTACLFLPKAGPKPAPCVIYCSGHTDLGFRSDTYQGVILNLVKKGFAVFAFDPIGQGERIQYLDTETGKSKIGGSTKEHTYAGVQTLLNGVSLSDYFIWDGVRAIDYLATRSEIDLERIGITGRSGGGTQSAMIAAYDDRIYAAAPECYITNFKRLVESIGPQDAEQNPYRAITKGFDHPDFLHLRAPKPSLIVTTTNDFFSQQGARETYHESLLSYSAFGATENLSFTEDFGGHESTQKNREAVYAFFQKHLNNPGDSTDLEVTRYAPEDLWVTPTGQLQSSIRGLTTFELNRKISKEAPVNREDLKDVVSQISGYDPDTIVVNPVYTGQSRQNGFVLDAYFLENEDYALPVNIIRNPEYRLNKTLIWIPEKGKASILENPLLEKLMNVGYTIVSLDLPGIGELHDPDFSGDGFIQKIPFNYTFGAHMVGKSIPGIYAQTLSRVVNFVKESIAPGTLNVLVEGNLNVALLHYTVFDNPFQSIIQINPLKSAYDLTQDKEYSPQDAWAIAPGSLPHYDIPTLKSTLPFYSVKTVEGNWEEYAQELIEQVFRMLR